MTTKIMYFQTNDYNITHLKINTKQHNIVQSSAAVTQDDATHLRVPAFKDVLDGEENNMPLTPSTYIC